MNYGVHRKAWVEDLLELLSDGRNSVVTCVMVAERHGVHINVAKERLFYLWQRSKHQMGLTAIIFVSGYTCAGNLSVRLVPERDLDVIVHRHFDQIVSKHVYAVSLGAAAIDNVSRLTRACLQTTKMAPLNPELRAVVRKARVQTEPGAFEVKYHHPDAHKNATVAHKKKMEQRLETQKVMKARRSKEKTSLIMVTEDFSLKNQCKITDPCVQSHQVITPTQDVAFKLRSLCSQYMQLKAREAFTDSVNQRLEAKKKRVADDMLKLAEKVDILMRDSDESSANMDNSLYLALNRSLDPMPIVAKLNTVSETSSSTPPKQTSMSRIFLTP